jgi:hypothetical protein
MPILTSPTVAVVEKDYSQVVPFAATGEGAIAGRFNKGPILQPVLISSTDDLESVFGRPSNDNYVDWFSAYNFLQYSSSLWVCRVMAEDMMNSAAKKGGNSPGVLVTNPEEFENLVLNADPGLDAAGEFIAKETGALSDAIRVIMVDNKSWAAFAANVTDFISDGQHLKEYCRLGQPNTSQPVIDATANDAAMDEVTIFVVDKTGALTGVAGRILEMFEGLSKVANAVDFQGRNIHYGKWLNQFSQYVYWNKNPEDIGSVTISNATSTNSPTDGFYTWTFTVADSSLFAAGETVTVSGVSGTGQTYNGDHVIDTIASSTSITVKNAAEGGTYASGGSMSVKTPLAWGINMDAASSGTFKTLSADGGLTVEYYDETMDGGDDGADLTDAVNFAAALEEAYNLFKNKETYSISYLIGADFPIAAMKYLIDSVAVTRRDAIAFVSPNNSGVPFFDKTTIVTDLLNWRSVTLNANTSFAVMDTGYKYQFDGYNQVYRWIPLAADVAGLCARNDSEFVSWASPGGFTRGQIKNVLKLSTNVDEAARNKLYPKQINAVVSFPGKGTVLFGDRTLQSKPSAFQSIHIRRMFIIIEKSIEEAAKYQLFEFNNQTTRTLFIGMIEPFLRTVKAGDGLDDFRIVCDTTNNTDDVIATGSFVADIYVKPVYSIQWVVLNFVAVKSSLQFNQFVTSNP